MITPGMQLGGAEIWVRTMITHMPAHRVQWQAVLIGHPHTKLDEKILAPIASRTRVIGIRPTPPQPEFPDLVERYESREEASRVALEGADLVICWASGWVLQELLAGFQGPVFAVSHGVCKWTVMDMRSQLSQGATHAVAVSRMAAGACPNPSAVKVLLNGVPPERAEPRRPRSVIRSEWGVDDPDSVLVGYVGRFSSEKNPMAAAAAVSQLPRQYRAVMIGEAASPDLAWSARREARTLAGDRVEILDATDDVADAYAALDVLVMASPREGCSLTVIEAWMAGVPVVATRVGVIPELEERFGPLVVSLPLSPTPAQLAEAVRQAALLGRESAFVRRAQQIAREHLTADGMTNAWADYLEEVIPREQHPRIRVESPRISVVVPAWNEATRIEKSLLSILNQTVQDFELLVVDDGSEDSTAELAERILSGRPHARVIRKTNGGTGSALNVGFSFAEGQYLTWWSADSWVHPRWLELLAKALDEHPNIVMSYSDWELFDQTTGYHQRIVVPEFDKARLLQECYVGPCWLFRRTAKVSAGPYLEEPCEDYDMHLRLAEIGPFLHVPESLGVWRNHPLNITTRLTSNPHSTRWFGQSARIQERHRQRFCNSDSPSAESSVK